MSITFQAHINRQAYPQKKVFAEDKYGCDSIADAHFFEGDPYWFKDTETGRFYEMVEDIDFEYEVNFSNDNFYSVIQNIDHNIYVATKAEGGCGGVKHADLPSFRRKLIKSLNTSKEAGVRPSEQSNNFYYSGIDKDGINSRISKMLEIVDIAQKLEVDVFWA